MKRSLTLLGTLAAIAVLATPVLACGDGAIPAHNLRATAAVKAGLRTAFLAAHPGLRPAQVSGPVSGQTYYGRLGDASGEQFALATFAVAGRAGAYPSIFTRAPHQAWRDLRDTHGGICLAYVPPEMVHHWWLEHWSGSCYVLPRR
jgi:hypothetical protein